MRTEYDVLEDFKKLGYKIKENSNALCVLSTNNDFRIIIRKYSKKYRASDWEYLDMQEHKLLTELFTIWNWV